MEHILRVALHRLLKDIVAVHHISPRIDGRVVFFDRLPILTAKLNDTLESSGVPLRLDSVEFDKVHLNVLGTLTFAADRLRIHAVPCFPKRQQVEIADTYERSTSPPSANTEGEVLDKSAHTALRILSSFVSALSASSSIEIGEIDFHMAACQGGAEFTMCPRTPNLRLHVVGFYAAVELAMPNKPQFVISCKCVEVIFNASCSDSRVQPVLQCLPVPSDADSATEGAAIIVTIAMPLVTKAGQQGTIDAGVSVTLTLGQVALSLTNLDVEQAIRTAREWATFVPVEDAQMPVVAGTVTDPVPSVHVPEPPRGGLGLLDRWFESAAKVFGGDEVALPTQSLIPAEAPSPLDELLRVEAATTRKQYTWSDREEIAGEEKLQVAELLCAQISASIRELHFNLGLPNIASSYAIKLYRVTYGNSAATSSHTLHCIHGELNCKSQAVLARLLSLTDLAVTMDAFRSQLSMRVQAQSIDINADIADLKQGVAAAEVVQSLLAQLTPQSAVSSGVRANPVYTQLELLAAALDVRFSREMETLCFTAGSVFVQLAPSTNITIAAEMGHASLTMNKQHVATLTRAEKSACIFVSFDSARRAISVDADSFQLSPHNLFHARLLSFLADLSDMMPPNPVSTTESYAPDLSWKASVTTTTAQFAQAVLLVIRDFRGDNGCACIRIDARELDVCIAAQSILVASASPGLEHAVKVVMHPMQGGVSSVEVDLVRLLLQAQIAHLVVLQQATNALISMSTDPASTTESVKTPPPSIEHRIVARLLRGELRLPFAPTCAGVIIVADARINASSCADKTSISATIEGTKLELVEGSSRPSLLADISAVQAEAHILGDEQTIRLLLPRAVVCLPLWNMPKLRALQMYLIAESSEYASCLEAKSVHRDPAADKYTKSFALPDGAQLAEEKPCAAVFQLKHKLDHIDRRAPPYFPVSLSLEHNGSHGPSMRVVLVIETATFAVELTKHSHRDLTVDFDAIGMAMNAYSLPHQLQRATPTTWIALTSTAVQIENCVVTENVVASDPSSCILLRSQRPLLLTDVKVQDAPFLYVSIMGVLPPRLCAAALVTEEALEWFLHTSTSDLHIILRGRLLMALNEFASSSLSYRQTQAPPLGGTTIVQSHRYFREVRLSSFRMSLDFDPEGFTATGGLQGVLPVGASISLVKVRGLSVILPTVFLQDTSSEFVAAAAMTQLVDHFARNQLNAFVARVPAAALPKLRELASQAYGTISLISSQFHGVVRRIVGGANIPTRQMTLGIVETGMDALASMSVTITQFAHQAAASGISEVEARSGELSMVAWVSLAGLVTWLQHVFRAFVDRSDSTAGAADQPAPQFGRTADEWVML
jgi:hypothetical protein